MRKEEDRESSEEFEIVLDDEKESPEAGDLLEAYAMDADAFTDKPWKKPGEDITDYFNYGFTETTWKEYLLKQRRLREEYTRSRAPEKKRAEWSHRVRRE
ncbi:hypothetical protein NEFER03_1305 [Nematocida sp. LUAm3]|nr:hypothetical protein NEFER03_1305 [Nematocida sp. LUAm3]KAI5174073.1 hypothetical protein NEFER02_0540 [Nematocida sp. LUAm2]KAI5177184.1 hypothetical protein NEFER01_0459 [Nematocida sp. LUAm1]